MFPEPCEMRNEMVIEVYPMHRELLYDNLMDESMLIYFLEITECDYLCRKKCDFDRLFGINYWMLVNRFFL